MERKPEVTLYKKEKKFIIFAQTDAKGIF